MMARILDHFRAATARDWLDAIGLVAWIAAAIYGLPWLAAFIRAAQP